MAAAAPWTQLPGLIPHGVDTVDPWLVGSWTYNAADPYSQVLQNWSNLGLGGSKNFAQILVETLPQGVQKCLLESCSFLACALRAQARIGQKGSKHFWTP